MEQAVKPHKRTMTHFRMNGPEMTLVATRTANHPELQFPPLQYVNGDQPVEEVDIGPLGRLYTYTVVHPGKEAEPYMLAMVDFEPGVRAFGRLTGSLQPAPVLDGLVRVVPFTLADGSPDYAFEPVQGATA